MRQQNLCLHVSLVIPYMSISNCKELSVERIVERQSSEKPLGRITCGV
jgi:hypothetical protein